MPLVFPVHNPSCEIWERVAFYAIASEKTFLGPPTDICSLALLSRLVYNEISWKHNTHLYARIFRFKFDYAAPSRRLSERWLTTSCLTSELIKRFQALKRIKAKNFKIKDLWTAYLMISEGDGKNEAQLLDYSSLPDYLQSLIIYRMDSHDLGWFKTPLVDSLVLWLLWNTSDRENVRRENQNYREYLIGILHSFIISGYRHSSVYASDVYYTLPLCDSVSSVTLFGALPPPRSDIVHYSHRLRLAAPVISSAALLALVIRTETLQDEANLPQYARDLPLNRADAIAQGRDGPTFEEVCHFHLDVRIPAMDRCPPVISTSFYDDFKHKEGDDSRAGGSKRHDEDWYRLVACHDPRVGDMPLRGVIYKPGSMAGCWEGRILIADIMLYYNLIHSRVEPATVSIRHTPLYWELQEHHCLIPNEPLAPGLDENSCEDILNGWLPRGAVFSYLEDAVEVYDPNTGHTARYDTFIPRSAAPYSKSASEKVQRSWISDESDGEIAENTLESVIGSENPDSYLPSTSYIDDDDEYSDTVSHLSSGISDILITGKTTERYSAGWGNFTIYGRVRPWDGLIVLLRVPTDPQEQYLGKWVFKGYLHNRNFVGRWRETSTPIGLIGYEGAFVVYKADAVDDS